MNEPTWEALRAGFQAVHEEAQRQHITPWGAMVSVRDAHNFLRVAYHAIAAASPPHPANQVDQIAIFSQKQQDAT